MINSRFEEHCDYLNGCDISERIALNTELDHITQEEIDEMYTQYELEKIVTNYQGILGEITSVDDITMYVQNMRKINLMGNIVTEYRGIITSEFGNSYYKDSWLSNTIMYSDTAIDFLEERIDWFDKEMLVPVVFKNDTYRYYTLMSIEAYLIQSMENYVVSEPVQLCTLEDIQHSKSRHFHPDFQDLDDFIDDQLYVDYLLDVANGNNYEGEYNLNYESYCIVASQFDSCNFYNNIVTPCTYTSNNDTYLDDDLPF